MSLIREFMNIGSNNLFLMQLLVIKTSTKVSKLLTNSNHIVSEKTKNKSICRQFMSEGICSVVMRNLSTQ